MSAIDDQDLQETIGVTKEWFAGFEQLRQIMKIEISAAVSDQLQGFAKQTLINLMPDGTKEATLDAKLVEKLTLLWNSEPGNLILDGAFNSPNRTMLEFYGFNNPSPASRVLSILIRAFALTVDRNQNPAYKFISLDDFEQASLGDVIATQDDFTKLIADVTGLGYQLPWGAAVVYNPAVSIGVVAGNFVGVAQ
jgi:hypothetical protein